jgi:hypothetical protein
MANSTRAAGAAKTDEENSSAATANNKKHRCAVRWQVPIFSPFQVH